MKFIVEAADCAEEDAGEKPADPLVAMNVDAIAAARDGKADEGGAGDGHADKSALAQDKEF